MSPNWNADQFVQLGNYLSDGFSLGATARQDIEKPDHARLNPSSAAHQQSQWSIKSLNALVRSGLTKLHGWLRRWFRKLAVRESRPNQNLQADWTQDDWTTETLIQMSQAQSSAFFVDCEASLSPSPADTPRANCQNLMNQTGNKIKTMRMDLIS